MFTADLRRSPIGKLSYTDTALNNQEDGAIVRVRLKSPALLLRWGKIQPLGIPPSHPG